MHENAPLHRREADRRGRPGVGSPPRCRDRLERARTLGFDQARALPVALARRGSGCDGIGQSLARGASVEHASRRRGGHVDHDRLRVGEQRRVRRRPVVAVRRVARDHHGSRAPEPRHDLARPGEPRPRRRCAARPLALPAHRQQRVWPRRARPRRVAHPGDPERVERQPDRLDQPEDLDRRRRRLWLVRGGCGQLGEQRQRLVARDLGASGCRGIERGERGEQAVEGTCGLVLGARERTLARPSRHAQRLAPGVDPAVPGGAAGARGDGANGLEAFRQGVLRPLQLADRVDDAHAVQAALEPGALDARTRLSRPAASAGEKSRPQERGGTACGQRRPGRAPARRRPYRRSASRRAARPARRSTTGHPPLPPAERPARRWRGPGRRRGVAQDRGRRCPPSPPDGARPRAAPIRARPRARRRGELRATHRCERSAHGRNLVDVRAGCASASATRRAWGVMSMNPANETCRPRHEGIVAAARATRSAAPDASVAACAARAPRYRSAQRANAAGSSSPPPTPASSPRRCRRLGRAPRPRPPTPRGRRHRATACHPPRSRRATAARSPAEEAGKRQRAPAATASPSIAAIHAVHGRTCAAGHARNPAASCARS